MRCRDEARLAEGSEGVVNLYRCTGLGFGRDVHTLRYSSSKHPSSGRGA